KRRNRTNARRSQRRTVIRSSHVATMINDGSNESHLLRTQLRERIAIDSEGLGNMWPVFYDAALFGRVVAEMAVPFAGRVDKIAGIEARGFLLGAAVAARLEVGFVAIRKAEGLYPGETLTAFTASDYRGRQHTFRLQRAAISEGDRVGLVD